MFNKKNIQIHLLSFFILAIGFILCRFVFFNIHGMKQWPELLFVAGLVFLAISFLIKGKTAPVFTSLAYSVGFISGTLLKTNSADPGGGSMNNLWIIWTVVFFFLALIGFVTETFVGKKKIF